MTRHTVLVVEDDPVTRQALAALLDLDGFTVVTAHDGVDALDQLGQGLEPCLILLDAALPRMPGAEFRRVQQSHPTFSRFPVAVISGSPDAESEARKLGIADFIRKPVMVDAVTHLVKRHCSRHP